MDNIDRKQIAALGAQKWYQCRDGHEPFPADFDRGVRPYCIVPMCGAWAHEINRVTGLRVLHKSLDEMVQEDLAETVDQPKKRICKNCGCDRWEDVG